MENDGNDSPHEKDFEFKKEIEAWRAKRMVTKKEKKKNTPNLLIEGRTTRSMSVKMQKILSGDDDDDNIHKRKRSTEPTTNLFQCYDVEPLVKKVKMHNENRLKKQNVDGNQVETESTADVMDKDDEKVFRVSDVLKGNEEPEDIYKEYIKLDEDFSDDEDRHVPKPNPFARIVELPSEKEQFEYDQKYGLPETLKVGEQELDQLGEYKSLIQKKSAKKKEKKKRPSIEHYSHINKSLSNAQSQYKIRKYKDGTYINCDVRYFNLASLGKFDVICIDPPWRISGAQRHGEGSNMFSNNNFKLNYNTLSNEEIMDMDIESLSDSGFCFLWVLNSTLQFGLACLNKWGYTYVDRIVWVKKTKSSEATISISHGYYFLHSAEICLIGVKYSKKVGDRLQYISKVTNDVLFAKTGKQSQKPEELYKIIETMLPGARKIEIFAKNHNIRKGWLSLGNRLGPNFDTNWTFQFTCCTCGKKLIPPNKRYKHKKIPDQDLCSKCFTSSKCDINDYWELDNIIEEPVFHDWFTCDTCGQYPICGVRFSCVTCEDFDLCEACFDTIILSKKGNHDETHIFDAKEIPDHGAGFPIHHRIRCNGCYICPIIGERFHCLECQDVNLCRKCFFNKKEPKQHKHTHEIEFIPESLTSHKHFKCFSCKMKPSGITFKCDTCADLILCDVCMEKHESLLPFKRNPSHKVFHTFTRIK